MSGASRLLHASPAVWVLVAALVCAAILVGFLVYPRIGTPFGPCVQYPSPRAGVASVTCGQTRWSDRTARAEREVPDSGAGLVEWELTFSQRGTVRSNRREVASVDGRTTVVVSWQKDWGELTSIRPVRL